MYIDEVLGQMSSGLGPARYVGIYRNAFGSVPPHLSSPAARSGNEQAGITFTIDSIGRNLCSNRGTNENRSDWTRTDARQHGAAPDARRTLMRGAAEFQDKVLSAMRFAFGDHPEKGSRS
jgi:hypothetical protein